MKKKKLEVVRGSGNVFRDLGDENADLDRFSVDRLMCTLNHLGSRVEVQVRARPLEAVKGPVLAPVSQPQR